MKKHTGISISEQIKSAWIVLVALVGVIYWAARHDGGLEDARQNQMKVGMLESRIIVLEIGVDKLQTKIDGMREDLSLIKGVIIK